MRTVLPEFVVGEYVFDNNHNIWEIISISGNVENIIYTATANGTTKTFLASEIIKLNKDTPYFNNSYDSKIIEYTNYLNKINAIPTPPDVINTGLVTPKFIVGEEVLNYKNNIYLVISIHNTVGKILYTIKNSFETKVVAEEDIFKLNEENKKMQVVYDKKIEEYENILNEINQKIIDL